MFLEEILAKMLDKEYEAENAQHAYRCDRCGLAVQPEACDSEWLDVRYCNDCEAVISAALVAMAAAPVDKNLEAES
jgi:hypothetical protein